MRATLKWSVLAAIGVVAVALVAWILWPQPGLPGQTQMAEANGVTVEATLAPGDAGDGLRFTVVLDTHTVDLSDYDIVGKARLETPDGTLRPTGTSRLKDNTGHHVEAHLEFDGERAGVLILVLEDLGGVPERRLEFDV